jgi:enoyl-[acyl-carrier-protein] reductase (NADH)
MPEKPEAPPIAYAPPRPSNLKPRRWAWPRCRAEPGGKLDPARVLERRREPYLQEYQGRGLLKDKAGLITGGDSGIGRSVAILMAREGADISFVHLPGEEEHAEKTIKEIKKAGRKAQGMALNLRENESCKKVVDEHMKVFEKLNVLVNKSAMQEICNDLVDINLNVVERTYRTNVLSIFSIFAMCRYALRI